MSNLPKVLSPLMLRAYALCKDAHGAGAYKKAAKKLGVSFLDVAPMVSDVKAYLAAYTWSPEDVDNFDWSPYAA